MKQSAPYAVIGLGVIAMAGIAWWFGFRERPMEEVKTPDAPAIELSEGLSIYTSGEHGFLLAYPEGAEVTESFDANRLPTTWSVSADDEGIPLLQIVTYRTQSEVHYPRDYTVVLRIGKSEEDAGSCTEAHSGEIRGEDRAIGGQSWASFSFGDAGMMQYVSAVSYRTVHEGACWAIETIRTGSSYREEASSEDIPDETLSAEYARLDTIVDSFRFAR